MGASGISVCVNSMGGRGRRPAACSFISVCVKIATTVCALAHPPVGRRLGEGCGRVDVGGSRPLRIGRCVAGARARRLAGGLGHPRRYLLALLVTPKRLRVSNLRLAVASHASAPRAKAPARGWETRTELPGGPGPRYRDATTFNIAAGGAHGGHTDPQPKRARAPAQPGLLRLLLRAVCMLANAAATC